MPTNTRTHEPQELTEYIDLLVQARARQREADFEVRRLNVEIAAAKSRLAITAAAKEGLTREDFAQLLNEIEVSW